MPLNAFIVRPFGVKELIVSSRNMPERLKSYEPKEGHKSVLHRVEQIGASADWKVAIDFDAVHEHLVTPALLELNIRGEAASAVVVAGNIREDMFHRLITADLVIADLSMHNANVFYELGIRQAFRDKYTFLIRSNLSEYPFDLKTDRYFDYDVIDLFDSSKKTVERLAEALRATIMSYKADSPVFKLLPKLEAEDRSRFIAVPDEFREEVGRARQLRLPEHLRMLAVECADNLWEIEGLREVGRAQFESNFIDDAKVTWEQIVNRYPDDIEANTTLSTVYQRRNDAPRSEQALARVSRIGALTANRQSQLRSLNGRNLKEAWTKQWDNNKWTLDQRQCAALSSPLLQRACDAFAEAFKSDLNNAYAGLNALTLLVIQTELARKLPEVWQRIQRRPGDGDAEQKRRNERIGQLIAALELAVEAERDRLRHEGTVDPWFSLLDASVACIVSHQPEYVAQLYEDARHFAPVDSERSMCRALKVYQQLQIQGYEPSTLSATNVAGSAQVNDSVRTVGTIAKNVERALKVLSCTDDEAKKSRESRRILMFAGQPFDVQLHPAEQRNGVPGHSIKEVKDLIKKVIDEEQGLTPGTQTSKGKGKVVFGLAAGASGGDLLFHEVCHELDLPTRICLALPRAEYVGRYVAPDGPDWVERFSAVYQRVDGERNKNQPKTDSDGQTWAINYFTDSNELPRWLQGRPLYDVGRRNNLWMLQHAIVAANELGENTEITLITHYDHNNDSSVGSIGHLVKQAQMAGIKVKKIELAEWQEVKRPTTSNQPQADEVCTAVKLADELRTRTKSTPERVIATLSDATDISRSARRSLAPEVGKLDRRLKAENAGGDAKERDRGDVVVIVKQ